MTLQPRRTLYRAAWVLPVATPPVSAGAVLVEGARIAALGRAEEFARFADAEIIDLGDAALLPGLVNVHAHPDLSLFRGALEDLPFPDWILRLVNAQRAVLRDEDYAVAARWSLVEAVRAGITTLAATEASAATAVALRESGLRGIVFREVFGPDPAESDAALAALRDVLGALRQRESSRIRIGVSPHAPYTVSDALFSAVADLARTEEVPLAIHIAESEAERLLVGQGRGPFAARLRQRGIATPVRGRSPVEMLDRLGVLASRPLLIHCVDVDADDIRRIADHGCAVAHCPTANAKLGHGVAPLELLHAAGVRVGLGTDSVGSNNRMDLLEEARFASLLQRALARRVDVLAPEALLRLCTIDGARALGLDRQIGTLEVGKEADLCAVSLAAPHVRPVHDPLAALFHAARASDVTLTVVQGRILYRDGRLTTLDESALGKAMEQVAERLREVLR